MAYTKVWNLVIADLDVYLLVIQIQFTDECHEEGPVKGSPTNLLGNTNANEIQPTDTNCNHSLLPSSVEAYICGFLVAHGMCCTLHMEVHAV